MKSNTVLQHMVGLLALTSSLQICSAATITEITWTDSDGTHTSTGADGATNSDVDVNKASTLVSFNAGGVLYDTFNLVTATTASGAANVSPYWGVNGTDLSAADDQLSLTDTRLDTGMVNIANDSEFSFSAAPSNLSEVLFIFDGGSDDGNRSVELIDGSGVVIGTASTVNFTVTPVVDFDWQRYPATTAGHTTNNSIIKGVALSFSDFGITDAGDLSSITGVRIDGGGQLDPTLIGFASIPEPSSAFLLGLGSVALIGRRRR